MGETTGAPLRRWLLVATADLGGAAKRADIHSLVEELFGSEFTEDDRKPRVGRPAGEAAWRNNLDSLYDRLKREGSMRPSRRGDSWTLSEMGLKEADRHGHDLPNSTWHSNFKPGSSKEYTQRVSRPEISVRSDHDPLIADYVTGLDEGWEARNDVYPRDLELRRHGTVWLVEAKMLYEGNATQAVRAAVGQLYEYAYFLYTKGPRPSLLALFSESIGKAYPEYLASRAIEAVWRTRTGWFGSSGAVQAGLVPMPYG
jgi:hypothetical protein